MPDPETVAEPYRKYLPEDSQILFTHGDFHPSNILVTSDPSRVAAPIDFEQSAWLPGYWKDCKARRTTNWDGEWTTRYLPLILDTDENVIEAWGYYTDPLGS
jgi:hypothetical protein